MLSYLPSNTKKDVRPALTGLSDIRHQFARNKQNGPASNPNKADV